MRRDYSLFIKDILQAINDIESFVGSAGFKEFSSDKKTRSAVVHEIEIIGEAAKNVPASIKDKYKELPWKDMARIRDKMSHFYFGINYEIVWKVIKENLPMIKPIIEKILKDLSKSSNK